MRMNMTDTTQELRQRINAMEEICASVPFQLVGVLGQLEVAREELTRLEGSDPEVANE